MIKIGEWKNVKIGGCLEAIGYVSNIVRHGFHGEQIELIKVVYVIGGPASRDFSLRRKLLEQAIGKEITIMEYTKAGWRRKR